MIGFIAQRFLILTSICTLAISAHASPECDAAVRKVMARIAQAAAANPELRAQDIANHTVISNAFSQQLGQLLYDQAIAKEENAVFSGRNLHQLHLILLSGATPETRARAHQVFAADIERSNHTNGPVPEGGFGFLAQFDGPETVEATLGGYHRGFAATNDALTASVGDKNIVDFGTGLFSTFDNAFSPEFSQFVSDVHGGVAKKVSTLEEINSWVAEKTRGLIKKLFDQLPEAALVTTFYFKGIWDKVFDKRFTHEADFHLANDTTKKVKMMQLSGQRFKSFGTDYYQAVSIPYADGKVVLDIVLPKEGDGKVADTGMMLSNGYGAIAKKLDQSYSSPLTLFVPQFSAGSRTDTVLEHLAELGFGDDLTFEGNKVSKLIHVAQYKQNEEGSEMAAASGAVLESTMMPVEFRADRPFYWYIRHPETGLILGQGLVMNPDPY